MNRIDQLFQTKKQNILSIYYPAGYPQRDHTCQVLSLLQQKGVDMVEIGIPFSDPLADGPIIQQAAKESLDQGMTLALLLEQLKYVRSTITMPILLMGYWNTVYQFGVERFLQRCNEIGIDGVILPDLPLEEYERHYSSMFDQYGIHNILLVTPNTTCSRLKKIGVSSGGFIYMVSSPATTGGKISNLEGLDHYYDRVKTLGVPSMMGFGIHDRDSFKTACSKANGAIIGTAFIEALKHGRAEVFLDNIT